MIKPNTGLPEFAFPSTFVSLTEKEQVHKWGMTLRDYFAAMALNGICANQDNRTYKSAESFAVAAYVLADAMLEARKT